MCETVPDIPDIYEAMHLPAAARLDERMPKNLFYQQPKFTRREEKLFAQDIERIDLRYALTPETTHLAPYRDDVREYGDVLVLEIALRQETRRARIAERFWQYLPRPQVLVFTAGERYTIAMALVRTNQADRTRNTVEESLTLGPLAADDPVWRQLDYTSIPATDFTSSCAASLTGLVRRKRGASSRSRMSMARRHGKRSRAMRSLRKDRGAARPDEEGTAVPAQGGAQHEDQAHRAGTAKIGGGNK